MTQGLFVIRLGHLLIRRTTEFIRFIMDAFIPLRSSARRRNLPHSFGLYFVRLLNGTVHIHILVKFT
jgi:hypothetical protein